MTTRRNGDVVSTGSGAECLGDPLLALGWLAKKVHELGQPLRAGEIVLSGALGPMVDVRAGDDFVAHVAGLGRVSVTFTPPTTSLPLDPREAVSTTKVAVTGSGSIDTDLLIKIRRLSDVLEVAALVGIDPESDGLARARRMGIPTTSDGVDGLIAMPGFDEIEIKAVLDPTSAKAHKANAAQLEPYGKRLIDLTPAAIGP